LSSVRFNFLANLASHAWIAATQLVVVPVYLRLLGAEAYGLIGFFVALHTTLQVLDLGLSQALMREIGLRRRRHGPPGDARSLVATVGAMHLSLGAVIGLCIVLAARPIATYVVRSSHLPAETVEQAITMMGWLVPVLWGANLLHGVLMGAERQVQASGIRVIVTTLNAGGAVFVLLFVSTTVTAFFVWQLAAGLFNCAIAAAAVHRLLPKGPMRFDASMLKGIWCFAAGMSGVGIGGVIISQLDKWLLITLLPLETYGHYMLAVVAANALYLVITPLYSSVYPRLTALQAAGNGAAGRELYHASSQYMAAIVLPLAAVISIFSDQVFNLWTRDAEISRAVAPIASVLVLGTALNGLMNIPYALQLAAGRSDLALRLVLLQLALFVPGIIYLSTEFGVIGSASAWLIINLVYLVIGVPLTHAWLLPGEGRRWLVKDALPPAAASFTACALFVLLERAGVVQAGSPLLLASVTLCALAAAAASVEHPRAWLRSLIRRRFASSEVRVVDDPHRRP
jgi:O-antigen/teichoic acid export membrane protein